MNQYIHNQAIEFRSDTAHSLYLNYFILYRIVKKTMKGCRSFESFCSTMKKSKDGKRKFLGATFILNQ